MSKILSFQLMAILFVLCFVVTPVEAASNQGLHWGVTIGSRFDYHRFAESVYETSPIEMEFYVIIDSLPSIADDINTMVDLPDFPGATQFYENGTEIEGSSGLLVFPVGNWSLIVSIWQSWPGYTTAENVIQDIISTPYLIGYNFTESWGSGNYTHAEIYVRATGVLHTSYSRYIDTEYELDYLTRISLLEGVTWPFPFDSSLGIAVMAIAGIVVILIVLVLFRRE